MGLFDPVWMTENEKKIGKAVAYVGKVKDAAELVTIAREAHFKEVRQTAIERITNQAALADIAMRGEGYDDATKAAIERIADPSQLDRVARGAESVTTRWLALHQLVKRFGPVDLAPYAEDIAGGVRAADKDMLALSEDLAFMEKAFDRHTSERYNWSLDCARRIRERANQVAQKRIATTLDSSELKHICETSIYNDEVRMAARKKIESIVAPDGADQRRLLETAIAYPAVRESTLSRLTDEQLLCEAVERIAVIGGGTALADVVGRIKNPALLARIARNDGLDPTTRKLAANRAGIDAPFVTRTLVCPECGGPVVYHEAFESIDSWDVVGFFRCDTHYGSTYVDAAKPLAGFAIGEVPQSALYGTGQFGDPGHLVLLCPKCGKLKGSATAKPDVYDRKPMKLDVCSCGCTKAPIPVKWSIDC